MEIMISAACILGYEYKQDNEDFIIYNKQLYSYLKQFNTKISNKYLPDWAFYLSSRQARILLDSMILYDSSYNNLNNIYYTSSINLANDIMQLALHCGWSSNKSLYLKAGNDTLIDGRNAKSNYDIWRLEITKLNDNLEVNYDSIENQDNQIEEIIRDYNKPVFCLQVTGGVFYVRRNGKAVWTGNSRARGPTQLLTRRNLP